MKISPSENSGKALFILNPTAGVQPVNFIVSMDLDRRKHELTVCKSMAKTDTGFFIRQNFDKHNVYIAAGGDGTVHTVASELVNSEKMLGVLPLGSGNGFAKEFGFKLNLRSLLSDIRRGDSMKIDVIEIDDKL